MSITEDRMKQEMKELAVKISFPSKNLLWLERAMQSKLLENRPNIDGDNHKEYSNEGLSTIGDAILKAVIADKLYSINNITRKGDITDKKKDLENNKTMHALMTSSEINLIGYSNNGYHFKKDESSNEANKVSCKKHDPYIEAIVGAAYYSAGYDVTKEWVIEWLLPNLENVNKALKKE